MKTTVQTSRGPVRFHSVGEPIAGIPANQASQHTPGPWTAENEPRNLAVYIQQPNPEANDGWVVATCWGEDRQANARLIAAAPELLAALEIVLALLSVVWFAFWGWVYTLLADFTQWLKDRFA